MSSPVGGAAWRDRGRDHERWQRDHQRGHDKRDAELDRRYLSLNDRLRKVERAVWTLAAVLATSTALAIINTIRSAVGAGEW